MKFYLTIALVALLFNFGAAKHVPRNLRTSASDDVVVQETAAESDLLDNNVVENEALVNNEESGSNSVNLLTNQPELALVQNAPTKTLSTVSHANLVSAPTKTLTPVQTLSVQAVPVQTATVQNAPLQTVNVLKSQAPLQNLVTKSAPLATSKTVVFNQVPSQTLYTVPQTQTVRYYQVTPQQQQVYSAPQQQVYSAPQQQVYSAPQQQVYSAPQQQQVYSAPQQQQVVYSVQQPQTQQYVYTVPSQQVYQAQPQQQLVSVQAQPQQQLVSVQAQPQQQLVSVQAQPQQQLVSSQQNQPQQQLVLLKNRQPSTSRTTNVWVDQTPLSRSSTLQLVQPAQLTKTVQARAPNPLVYQVQPSRQSSLSRQTVLSGAQLSSDVADESRASDFVVQEAESSY